MEKISGFEKADELPEKVLLLYHAVGELLDEGADLSTVKVSVITSRAGIGKGTAYDYFETKDEMIASALVFIVKDTLQEIQRNIDLHQSLAAQVNAILETVEGKTKGNTGLIRFVHMMTDPTPISCMFREKLESQQDQCYNPIYMLEQILVHAKEKGEIGADLPMKYMLYALASRVITYLTYLAMQEEEGEETAKMRQWICSGLLKEFSH